MKILWQPPRGWWIGRENICRFCNTAVKLELYDRVEEKFDPLSVEYECPVCGNRPNVFFTDYDNPACRITCS